MTLSRPATRLALAAAAAALVTTTAAGVPAAADPTDPAGPAERAQVGTGLFSPLSLAVQTNGTVWVSQNFAGELVRQPRGGKPAVVATARNGEIGAVSVSHGVVTYAVSRGNNEQGLVRQIRDGRNRLLADLGGSSGAQPRRRA